MGHCSTKSEIYWLNVYTSTVPTKEGKIFMLCVKILDKNKHISENNLIYFKQIYEMWAMRIFCDFIYLLYRYFYVESQSFVTMQSNTELGSRQVVTSRWRDNAIILLKHVQLRKLFASRTQTSYLAVRILSYWRLLFIRKQCQIDASVVECAQLCLCF